MAGGSWMGNDPAGSNPTHMNPYSKVRQGWVTTTQVAATTLGVTLNPRSIASEIVEIQLGGTTSGSCTGTAGLGADERIYVEYLSNRIPGAIFDKAVYASGLLIWHYDRCGSNNKSASAPARYRMGVQEYDFRDGTQELQLNLNRGEPTDVWWDTALGMTPNTTPSTNRNTLLAGATSTKTGWYLMNISDIGDSMTLDIVQQADVQDLVGVDRPQLLNQPVIVGTGPATFSTKVYNLTAADLLDVKVEFWATVGCAAGQAGRDHPGDPAPRRPDGRHRHLGRSPHREVEHHGQSLGAGAYRHHTRHGACLPPHCCGAHRR